MSRKTWIMYKCDRFDRARTCATSRIAITIHDQWNLDNLDINCGYSFKFWVKSFLSDFLICLYRVQRHYV